MAARINPVFAVPLAEERLPAAESLNGELKALFLAREAEGSRYENPVPSLQIQPGVFESDFDLFSWPEPCIRQLREFCWKALGQVVAELNGYREEELRGLRTMAHAWFHVTRYGGFTTMHTHPMASWSGVYCVTAGEPAHRHPESGVLKFHSPHHYSNYFLDGGNARLRPPYHHGTWNVRLQPGRLLLFPSWLQHEVMPFFGGDERITVAFNAWFGTKDG